MSSSYIKMDANDVKSMCDKALINIIKERNEYRERMVEDKIEYKNSGIIGWLRSKFGYSFNREKAIKSLKSEMFSTYVLSQDMYRDDEKDIKMLLEIAKKKKDGWRPSKDYWTALEKKDVWISSKDYWTTFQWL